MKNSAQFSNLIKFDDMKQQTTHYRTLLSAVLAISFLTLTSCEKDEQFDVPDISERGLSETLMANPYNIPVEDALENLRDFMADFSETGESRSGDGRVVSDVIPVRFKDCFGAQSRSEFDDIECDKLLYIANFENNQGYAVLAADERISNKVIGLIDSTFHDPGKGTTPTPRTIWDWDDIIGGTRPVFKDYPTDGPGFFTVTEYPDELFINPNTVDLYDKDKDDTLVGTYFFDEDEISRSGGDEEQTFDVERFAMGLCTSYAANEIISYGLKNPDLRSKDTLDPRISGFDHSVTYKILETGPWENINTPTKYLSNYKEWHQRRPFNALILINMFSLVWELPDKFLQGVFL